MTSTNAFFPLAFLAFAQLASAASGRSHANRGRIRDIPGLQISAVMRSALYPTVGGKKQIARAKEDYQLARTLHKRWTKRFDKLTKRAARPGAKPYLKVAVQKARVALRSAGQHRNATHKRLQALRFRPGRGKVIIRGQKLPTTCFCKRASAGESKCYFYTRGRRCSMRYCAAKFECVGKKKARGALCSLRKVDNQIVSIGGGRCRTKYIQSYMYVPYDK